jgi:hypothetical protein
MTKQKPTIFRRLTAFFVAFIFLGTVANMRAGIEQLVINQAINAFPTYFANNDASRLFDTLAATGNIALLIAGFYVYKLVVRGGKRTSSSSDAHNQDGHGIKNEESN